MKINKKQYHYFYKITNLINGHFYYGVHNTDNLNDGYMGSGIKLHKAYEKYGIENFTKEILKFFNTANEAFDYEAEVVTENLVSSNECYNIAKGGIGGNSWDNSICINMVVVRDKNGNCLRVSKDDPRYLSGELVSNTTGFIRVKDKQNNIYVVKTNDERYLNKTLVPLQTGRKWSDEQKTNLKNIFSVKKHQQGEKNSQFGTKWIYKDDITKKIKKEELDSYLADGWKIGRIYHKKLEG